MFNFQTSRVFIHLNIYNVITLFKYYIYKNEINNNIITCGIQIYLTLNQLQSCNVERCDNLPADGDHCCIILNLLISSII
jgi:hypothetical protein